MKNRKQLIEELETVQYNIQIVEMRLSEKLEENNYFLILGTSSQFEHNKEIQTKCLAYWKKRFNRTLLKLSYKL